MKTGKILEDVKCRLPNAFSDDNLILWLDQAVRDLYKVLAKREGFSFQSMGGQILYPLPADVQEDLISAVVVGKREREARRIGDTGKDNCWFGTGNGFLGFYPAPKRGEKITIWYKAKPPRLFTAAECAEKGIDFDKQDIPLDEDFEELLKLALCITIAEAREDVALANNYKISYNLLLGRARQERYEKDGKYPVTKIVQK